MKPDRHFPRRLALLYDDPCMIAAVKEAGYLSCDIRGGSRPNALDALSEWMRRGVAKSRACAWLVHRLDRDTSGVMLFAKSREARDALQAAWGDTEKKYLAAIDGEMPAPAGRLENHLREDADFFVRCFDRPAPGSKAAALEYATIARGRGRSLVEVRLITGRKNQIRVQFARAGHPVLGDAKYGGRARAMAPRMMLHALSISFTHPSTGERMSFSAPAPQEFRRMFPDAFPEDGRPARG